VVALSLKYYRAIPKLFEFLLKETTQDTDGQKATNDFFTWLDRRFNSYWVTGIALTLTLGLNGIYFHQILDPKPFTDWMTGGEHLLLLSSGGLGLTDVGMFAAFIQIVLIYWVFNLVWRGAVLAWGLHELFNERAFPVRIQPLHPDRCCGLRRIGEVAMLLNMTLFLLGIYISLKVVDKIVMQDSPLSADIGNPIMLGAYFIVAPLLFFFPLGAAHERMAEAREKFLEPVSRHHEQLFSKLGEARLDEKGQVAVQTFAELDQTINRLHKEISVWPFDFRSLQAFTGSDKTSGTRKTTAWPPRHDT
jgi:hypothetical protein